MKKPSINEDKINLFTEEYLNGDKEKSMSLLQKLLQEQHQARIDYYKENPVDAPNDVLKHALIEGIGISNDFILSKGELNEFFTIGYEKFYCWTHETDEYSNLVVEVNQTVKEKALWKTGISILEIAFTMASELESNHEFAYDWVYRFNHSESIDNLHYLKDRHNTLNWRSMRRIHEFSDIAVLIEILTRDDKFFIACQNIIAAKQNHEFCQICALTPEHLRKHKDHEPEIWERINLLPKMEAAIVQATRSVEAILGKPGKKDTEVKLRRAKERWSKNILINPDEEFKLTGQSYLDYYYDLFELRNNSAHSYGSLSFDLQRQETIEAQSFAWIIIGDYYKKNSISEDESLKALDFNIKLINQFKNVNVSSKGTKNGKYAP
ncbi:hypothetical protein [Winogradskyella sp. PC D3.3]|jgi:hypothetical protein